MRAGVSPLISMVILVAIIFGIAAFVAPWMYTMVTSVTNETAATTGQELQCQNTAYDFDTDFATFGVDWNFTGATDSLSVKVINTGNINLYGFSFELELNRTVGNPEIKYFEVNETSQRTAMNPLKPGQSAILEAVMDQDLNGTLVKLKVLNPVCPRFFVAQEF